MQLGWEIAPRIFICDIHSMEELEDISEYVQKKTDKLDSKIGLKPI